MAVSARRLYANRRNAQKSTGPTSERGKAKSRRNATKHGLSVSATFEGALPERWEELARALAAGRADLLPLARAAAEARYNIHRIGEANRFLVANKLRELRATEPHRSADEAEALVLVLLAPELRRRGEYERSHRVRWRRLKRQLDEAVLQHSDPQSNPRANFLGDTTP